MWFSGAKIPCKCITVEQNKDNAFDLSIDKMKLTIKDKGTHVITVTIFDNNYSKTFLKNTEMFEIQI
jgi:hypothetical protein